MVSTMKHKIDKYFEDYDNSRSNKLFEFAAILDPGVKLTIIEYGCIKNCELMKKDGKLKTDKEFKEKVKEMVDGVESEMHKLLREYEDFEPAGPSIPINTVDKVGVRNNGWVSLNNFVVLLDNLLVRRQD
ncbi:hypothetical protein Hdeb2414_s0570g00918371 [Helianthus debilis subsp. tardiflorus]